MKQLREVIQYSGHLIVAWSWLNTLKSRNNMSAIMAAGLNGLLYFLISMTPSQL